MADTRGAGGSSSGRKKFSQDKWRQILQASAETFAAKGYEATTIRDIAESVGMLGGSLYYYIATKEDLLYELIDDFHRVGMEGVAAAEAEVVEAGQGDDPLVMLRAVCQRHAEINARSRTLSAVFYNDFRYLGAERKQHIVESRRQHQRRIESLLSQCQEAGVVRAELDPRLTALAMLAALNSTNAWYDAEHGASTDGIGQFLASLLIDGIAEHGSASPPTAERRQAAETKTPQQSRRRTRSSASKPRPATP